MRKSDLKTGMTVKYRNGSLAKVLKDVNTEYYGHQDVLFAGKNGFMNGDSYLEDLHAKMFRDYDIIEIYQRPGECVILDFDTSKLLWRREEVKKLTVAEVEAELGYKVEIISEKGEE